MAQSFLHRGEDFGVLPRLAIDDPVGVKSDASEGGRKKITAMQAPQNRTSKAGEDSGGKQRGDRGVAPARTAFANLMDQHVREDVPGLDVKAYGGRGRTSSKGTFAKAADYESGGGLAALFTGGWMRVAKDRIDPVAWSHQFGFQRKTEGQHWRHHFVITERNGHQSDFQLPREKLAGTGAPALRLLMKAGVHVVGRNDVQNALMQFLRFKPRREIIRMPRVGWAEVGSHS